MTRIKSILCASLITLVASSSAFAGDMFTRSGSSLSRSGDMFTRAGDMFTAVASVIGIVI